MTTISPAFRDVLNPILLALADDELIIGHRHSEWTGWAPHIEEDIAFSSIAQDEIGHAALFYRMLAEVDGTNADAIALGRQAAEYRNAIICERPNDDWAFTLARHFLYDSADRIRLESLRASSYKPLAEVSEKLLREERYHQLHADAWFRRLTHGPLEGRHQFSIALSTALPDGAGIFEATEAESGALEIGVLSVPSEELTQRWLDEVVGRIEEAGLPVTLSHDSAIDEFVPTSSGEIIEAPHAEALPPSIIKREGRWVLEGTFAGMGGRRGKHSEDFAALWDDLTKTYREEPTASW